MNNFVKNKKGMVLVLSMLIIAAVLASAAVFGSLIIREIRQSRLVDHSIQAFYLAESGAERSLYQVRKRVAAPSCSGSDVCEENGFCGGVSTGSACVTEDQGTLDGDFVEDWSILANTESELDIILVKGSSFQVDLFSPLEVSDADITQLRVEELDDQALSLYGELTNLTKVLGAGCLSQSSSLKGFISVVNDSNGNFIADFNGFAGGTMLEECSYVFKIDYPFFGEISGSVYAENNPVTAKIRLKAFNSDGDQVDIPSRLIIESTGQYGNSFQKVTVKTPARPLLSGLYGFVIFAEQQIIKSSGG